MTFGFVKDFFLCRVVRVDGTGKKVIKPDAVLARSFWSCGCSVGVWGGCIGSGWG
jgi:hypothetical protein